MCTVSCVSAAGGFTNGEGHFRAKAACLTVCESDRAAVRKHDLPHDQKSESVPRLRRAAVAHHIMRRILQRLKLFIGKPCAVVLHRNTAGTYVRRDADKYAAAVRIVRLHVGKQILHGTAQQILVSIYTRGIRLGVAGIFERIISLQIGVDKVRSALPRQRDRADRFKVQRLHVIFEL